MIKLFLINLAKRNKIDSEEKVDYEVEKEEEEMEGSTVESSDIKRELPNTLSHKEEQVVSSKRVMSERQMGLAIFMKDIRIDNIFQHLFNKTIMGTNWMVNLNIGK